MQTSLVKYNCTNVNRMWKGIGDFLKLYSRDNVYVYGKYSYLGELPITMKLYIMKRDNSILFENFGFYFEQITSVHFYQLIDQQGRAIQNPLRIRGFNFHNTDPFEPSKALYMSIKVRNYTGPEVPDDFDNEEYTKEYYFMKTTYGIFVSDTGFSLPQNMHLITTTQTKNLSNEEIIEVIRSTFDEDFSEDDDDSDSDDGENGDDNSNEDDDDSSEEEIEVSLNHSNHVDNSHVPLN